MKVKVWFTACKMTLKIEGSWDKFVLRRLSKETARAYTYHNRYLHSIFQRCLLVKCLDSRLALIVFYEELYLDCLRSLKCVGNDLFIS